MLNDSTPTPNGPGWKLTVMQWAIVIGLVVLAIVVLFFNPGWLRSKPASTPTPTAVPPTATWVAPTHTPTATFTQIPLTVTPAPTDAPVTTTVTQTAQVTNTAPVTTTAAVTVSRTLTEVVMQSNTIAITATVKVALNVRACAKASCPTVAPPLKKGDLIWVVARSVNDWVVVYDQKWAWVNGSFLNYDKEKIPVIQDPWTAGDESPEIEGL